MSSTTVSKASPAVSISLRTDVGTSRRRRRRAILPGRTAVLALLCSGALVMLFPFLWLVSTSFKEQSQIFLYPPQWIPNPIRWQNYSEALTQLPFARYTLNTLVITIFTIAGVLLTSSLAAYGFARTHFPGRDIIFMVLLSTLMLPYAVIMIPQYIMFKYLGWIDTNLPLIVPFWFGGGIFNIFLLRQFFRTIPPDLIEAARIDGAGELRIYAQIVLPLAGPALAVVAIFTFINSWNDFLGPLIYLSSQDKFTIALGLSAFKGLFSTRWEYLMAASTVMITPIIVLFFLTQRYFVQGIAMTGTKG
jgi:multiple sugar transport system permease protein